jgi:hypothetical protein
VIEQVDESLWVVEGECVCFMRFPYPTRSIIVRLENGDLWVWSPVRLTSELHEHVDRLGPVRHLVSPNKLHHLFLREWNAAFPEAKLWGPESTIRKRKDLHFQEPLRDTPPVEWAGEVDQAWFRGSFAMDELEFFHRPSNTAIIADLIQTFSDSFLEKHWGRWGFLARLDGITERQAGAPRDWRSSFIDRRPARRARDKVLSWDCQRVVLAHGELPRSNGRDFLKRSLSWIGSYSTERRQESMDGSE